MTASTDDGRDTADLDIVDVGVTFQSSRGEVRAVDGVTMKLHAGRAIALVGESGSGKSALVRAVLGLHDPTRSRIDGRIEFGGRDLLALTQRELRSVRGRLIALVPQDPLASLNPARTVAWHLRESLRVHGLASSRIDVERRSLELLDAVRLTDARRRLGARPHELSGGMRQRVLIAMALACGPQVLIADEPTTALDVTVQRQILDLLRVIQDEQRMSLLFVTHDLGVAGTVADQIAVMYAGRLVELGPAASLLERPAMPYTQGLLDCAPDLDQPDDHQLVPMPGALPDPTERPSGCRFAPRCLQRLEHCTTEEPDLTPVAIEHVAACWRV